MASLSRESLRGRIIPTMGPGGRESYGRVNAVALQRVEAGHCGVSLPSYGRTPPGSPEIPHDRLHMHRRIGSTVLYPCRRVHSIWSANGLAFL
jgi:hypothetical protein